MQDLLILESFWDRRRVKDKLGKEFEILRGKDYDFEWQSLGYGYSKDLKGIYHWDKECFRKYKKDIDISSFELIDANKSENTFYFKDKAAVYLDSYMCSNSVIKNANPENFSILDIDKGYTSSGNIDFWYETELPYALSELVRINGSYQKVGDSIYFGHINKLSCDVESFKIINPKIETVAKDDNNVYFKSEIIEGANPETFHFLEQCVGEHSPYYLQCDIHFYAKDDKYAYFINSPFEFKIIKTKSLDDFTFIVRDDIGYGIDSTYYYKKGRRKRLSN